jgi:hypothetical protein
MFLFSAASWQALTHSTYGSYWQAIGRLLAAFGAILPIAAKSCQ